MTKCQQTLFFQALFSFHLRFPLAKNHVVFTELFSADKLAHWRIKYESKKRKYFNWQRRWILG